MKHIIKSCAIGMALIVNAPIAAATALDTHQATENQDTKTITFAIEKMTCAMCPITVRKAMEKVDGVLSVTTDYESRTAQVVFDPAKAKVDMIAKASTDAGYPAKRVDSKKS